VTPSPVVLLMKSYSARNWLARVISTALTAGLALAVVPRAGAAEPEAAHVSGIFDIGLVLVAGLVIGLVAWAINRRTKRQLEQHTTRRIREMTALIEHADGLLWEAEVELNGPDWLWSMTLHNSAFCRKLFNNQVPVPGVDLWIQFKIDDRAEMDRRSRAAVTTGQPGYVQEFCAVRDGQAYWLHENVSIRPLGRNRFWLVGLVTDITPQRAAEAARRQSELTVDRILEQAQCLLWRANVILEDGVLKWPHFDIPQSQFSELLFGDRVFSPDRGFWETMNIPEQPEMDERSTKAIRGGAEGYAQEFRAINRTGRVFWLHERVSITRVTDTRWSLVGVVTDITSQHEAEEARRTSETRLSHLLERADTMIWQAQVRRQADGQLDWSMYIPGSRLYRSIFAADPVNPLGFAWAEYGVPEHVAMKRRSFEAITRGAPGYDQVFHVPSPAGDIWLSEKVTIAATGPDQWELVGVVNDITGQRAAEAAHEASEARLQGLLDRADCLLWEARVRLADWSWRNTMQHSGLSLRLFGERPWGQEMGLWREFNVPERAEMDERCRLAMQEGRPGYEQVFHIIKPDGSVIWISESVTVRRINEGEFSLVGVAVDITPQRGAEEALAAEKERLAVTLRAMNECVITTDVAGVVQFMNPAAATLTGWETAAGCGRPVAEICQLQNSRSDQPVEVPIARVARGDTVADLPAHTRLVTRAGGHRKIEGCCAPIHAADSKVTGTVLVFRDVTEQDRLEQELVRATRLESVGVLAGGIAHDFNNILTAVMGNLALVQLDIAADSPAGSSLRSAEKAALRARDLTQQLLTFAKGGEPVRAAVQLESIVREMAAFALHGSQVKASFDLAPDLWPADADKGQIGRVVQNLVINAVQAMPRGGTLRIMARNDTHDDQSQPGLEPGDYIQIAITDSGEGIKPDHVARIFDPYFTTKQTGTGLGLAAVYSIVKKHHGHIDVESQLGQGTTFRIWLPALRQQKASTDTRNPWADTPDRMTGRVLFMDDEQIIREMAVILLKRFGLAVDCAADGTEAIAKYRAALGKGTRYDLVIMDLTIPGGMGGLAALGQLRAIDPAVKAVVSSGYSSDPVLANFRAHGFVAVIAKPYEFNELSRVLREVLPRESRAPV